MRIVRAVVFQGLSFLLLGTLGSAQQQEQPRIAVKLTSEGQEKQQADSNFISTLIQKGEPQGLVPGTPTVTVTPLIGSQQAANIKARVARTVKRDDSITPPNFDAWYQVQIPTLSRSLVATAAQNETGADGPRLALPQDVLNVIHKLHKLPEVESAHVLHPGPPPAVNPSDDPRSGNQGYLNTAPAGINARYAWGFPGGDGAGINIVDVEQGWNLNHEDLAAAGITLISGHSAYWFAHGTSVLGELVMVDNQLGGIGIVPAAKARVISQHRDDWSYNTAAAILDAAAHMSFGDIMLLEAQEYDPVSGVYYWPVSVADATFDAIQVATSLGINVVEAGCNGAYDLDQYINLSGKRIFDRSSADYRESGAIMVGGANSWVPHTRWYGSNYGSRIDVYAWAEGIDTTETDDTTGTENWYTSWFGGTSGASPIIVGSAAIIQGMTLAAHGKKLSPLEIRTILTSNGTASDNPAIDRIGIMPDLKAIIDTLFPTTPSPPNLFIRDHIADTPLPTAPFLSSSPDIIILPHPLPNPQLTLGTSNINNPTLSGPVLSTNPNHTLYLRLQNLSPSASPPTNATIYFSPPSTLLTPNHWTQIGTIPLPSIPPSTNSDPSSPTNLTVSPALTWSTSSLPNSNTNPSGQYSFIAIAGDETHPKAFPEFIKFTHETPNVAFRSFNVVSSPPSGSGKQKAQDLHHFPVNIPGAFDEPREFTIKAIGSLPKGSKVRLQVPQELAQALGVKGGCVHKGKDGDKKAVVMGLQPSGTVQVGKGVLPVGSLANCELQVRVPTGTYTDGGDHEFALVQEWEGVEVGRVTWRFGPVVDL